MNRRLLVIVASLAVVLTACGGGTESAATKTVTQTVVPQTVTPTSTLTKGALPPGRISDEQAFISVLTMFSGYWAMQDANSLVALGRTTCNWIGMRKADGFDTDQALAVVAVKVRQSFGSNPPTLSDAQDFARASLNNLCPDKIR